MFVVEKVPNPLNFYEKKKKIRSVLEFIEEQIIEKMSKNFKKLSQKMKLLRNSKKKIHAVKNYC